MKTHNSSGLKEKAPDRANKVNSEKCSSSEKE